MRAVLLVPETKRVGLTGKPLLNTQGIVGSLKGSFQAGQRVTLVNLRGISAKIQEAQQAINGAGDNIRRAGETIDDIKEGSNQLSHSLNDYWQRWDRKGVHDEYGNLQFLATATNMDVVRTSMLGESVDPAPLLEHHLIPRGMYWDPVFEWDEHKLDKQGRSNEYLYAFSTRNPYGYLSLSQYQVAITTQLTSFAAECTLFAGLYQAWSANLLNNQLMIGLGFLASPATNASYQAAIASTSIGLNVILASVRMLGVVVIETVAIVSAFVTLINALMLNISNMKVHDFMGTSESTYQGSPIQLNTLFESHYCYAVCSAAQLALFSSLYMPSEIYMGQLLSHVVRQISLTSSVSASLRIIFSAPDIVTPTGPIPNAPAVAGAVSMVQGWSALIQLAKSQIELTLSEFKHRLLTEILPSTLVVNVVNTTRVNGPEPDINSKPETSKPQVDFMGLRRSKRDADAWKNWPGNLLGLHLDSAIDRIIGSLTTVGGNIVDFLDMFIDKFVEVVNLSQPEQASAYAAGSVSSRDCYIYSKLKNPYTDWWWNECPSGFVSTIGSIAGTGNNTQTFYGNVIPKGTASGDLLCWSHVYDKNLFSIRPQMIGNRTIEKTIVVKTKSEFSNGIFRAFTVLVKCTGSDKLWLLMERSMCRFNSGNPSDVELIEQIVYNFDPHNYGDFFTSHRGGKVAEVFCYTFDNHIISFRPGLEFHDNYLLGDFVNREVTHYDDFEFYSRVPDNGSSEGDISSYYNKYY